MLSLLWLQSLRRPPSRIRQRIYDDLLKPSLLLWASQLIVFAVYRAFHGAGSRRWRRTVLAAASCAFAVYGRYTAVVAGSS